MSATVHQLTQGSPEWLAHRKDLFNASEASAMLNISTYKSRDDLLREKATGITDPIDAQTQRLFNDGHRLESLARPKAEKIIGEDLFSPTVSITFEGLKLSASFDGLTMMDDISWEHKMLNEKLRKNMALNIIPEEYKPQLEQQLLISSAEKCLFMASDGVNEPLHVWYEPDPLIRKRLIAGWKQFAKDLEAWEPVEVVVKPVAKEVEQLPSLNVQITGGVTSSNLEAYENNALAFISAINTDLKTDSDFANADAVVKFCGQTEKELEQVKQAALDQTADISTLFKTIDNLKSEMRSKRLELDKLVKSRKANIKDEIATKVHDEYASFIHDIDADLEITSSALKLNRIHIVSPLLNIEAAMKNKRTIESLRNAVNTELARCKILIDEQAGLIRSNLKLLEEFTAEYNFLFHDIQNIITKEGDDFYNMALMRISEHKKAEEKRIEEDRERIRLEEEKKAQQKVDDEAAEKAAKAEKEALNKVAKATTDNAKKRNAENLAEVAQEEIANPDYEYFRNQIGIILTNIDNYTKDELRRAFKRLADAV